MPLPTKRWPVHERLRPMLTVEAPDSMVDTDTIEIAVSLTPMRAGKPLNRLHQRQWITTIEARDSRAVQFILRQMLNEAMRAWNEGQ